MVLSALSVSAFVLAAAAAAAGEPAPQVAVKTTHKHLLPRCLDGTAVEANARSWRLTPGAHSLAFTMRNEPRNGTQAGEPGIAAVSFALEPGHAYEVEVRASPTSFSSRVWARGDWKPVVRDRTTDRIVSDEPTWIDAGCAP